MIRTVRLSIAAVCISFAAVLRLLAADPQVVKELILPGESFLIDGRPAFVMLPIPEKRSTPQPWIMYAPTLPGYPDTHEKWMHERFLDAGIAVAGIDAGEAYGSPAGRAACSQLYEEMTHNRHFAPRPCLLGRSRGGLWVSSWAIENPEKVAGIAGIYPVFDLRTYPGLDKAAPSFELSTDALQQRLDEFNPIAQRSILAQAAIPACIIHGDQDTVVPLRENSATLADAYRRAGNSAALQLIVAHGQGHNFWEGFFRCDELVTFAIARAKAGVKPHDDPVAQPAEKASADSFSSMVRQAKRVVFLGDSITHAGDYIAQLDAWIMTRDWPTRPTLLNMGLPSETVSGLSEEGHAGGAFPRPDLDERLDRVLALAKADLVVACYGINCGIYEPFDEARFRRYQEGIIRLSERVQASGAKLVFITPPTYDDARAGKPFSYNEVLDRYAEWLVDQSRAKGWIVIDVHGPMTRALAGRRTVDPNFTFQPDAVHPNADGHWFVASQLIAALGDPLAAAAPSIDAVLRDHDISPELLPLIKQRLDLLRDAYVATAGHKRPGMPAGLPLNEAEEQVRELTQQISRARHAHVINKTFDVVVYGGTSAAVTTAIQVRRMGKSAIIVSPDKHIGGLTSGGLGWTDSGNKDAIGGLSREFYHRIWRYYQRQEAWRWEEQAKFGNRNQSPPGSHGDGPTMWVFEPHVAEEILERWLQEHNVPVIRDAWLERGTGRGVTMENNRIAAITTTNDMTLRGHMFVDATYEGDLMAEAGVDYHVGREANSVYQEAWNGVQVGTLHHGHWFKRPIDPYVEPGNPQSGLLPRISAEPPGTRGEGDHRIQAYCYRMCLTQVEANRIPFERPNGYDAQQYELLLRVFASGWRETFEKFDPIPNRKTDTNNHGPFSTDNIGRNYDYPEASYERRQEILEEHRTYQQGLMYFMANDPRVPEDVRSAMSNWGLAKDEFVDNGGWPHQIYVREARRMLGKYVMTEHDCLDRRVTPESIGMGSYILDSHNVQRYVTPEGTVQNEGDIGVAAPRPYEIAYGSIIPRDGECENLLVPICISSSHIAYGSIRMEPVFMILGQSAGTAACLALDRNVAVQELPYEVLRAHLLADVQVLELSSK